MKESRDTMGMDQVLALWEPCQCQSWASTGEEQEVPPEEKGCAIEGPPFCSYAYARTVIGYSPSMRGWRVGNRDHLPCRFLIPVVAVG